MLEANCILSLSYAIIFVSELSGRILQKVFMFLADVAFITKTLVEESIKVRLQPTLFIFKQPCYVIRTMVYVSWSHRHNNCLNNLPGSQ